MPQWDYKLNVTDVVEHFDSMGFGTAQTEIVGRIKNSEFASDFSVDAELGTIILELQEAENIVDFNATWDWFYDWCDAHSVWVETVTPKL